jgi:hypothetical protein
VWDAATALVQVGAFKPMPQPVSALLNDGYAAAKAIWNDGSVADQQPRLAMNFLMDRSITNWGSYLTAQKAKVGACDTTAPIIPTGNLSGRFSWTCESGRINGTVLLAPTATAQIQALDFAVAP